MTSRNYCFTYWKQEIVTQPRILVAHFETLLTAGLIKYAIFQQEISPTTKQLHLQGYLELTDSLRIAGVKTKIFNSDPSVHLEKRFGSRQQAIDYCRKKDSHVDGPWEVGCANITQGTRTDLHDVAFSIQKGSKLADIVQQYPVEFIKFNRGIEKLIMLTPSSEKTTTRDVVVDYYYGTTGSGKTHAAMYSNSKDGDLSSVYKLDLVTNGGNIWFDGYSGQETIVIDEFYSNLSLSFLLKILDKWPLPVQTKGGTIYANWKRVCICSGYSPWDMYKNLPPEVRAMWLRRITHLYQVSNRVVTEVPCVEPPSLSSQFANLPQFGTTGYSPLSQSFFREVEQLSGTSPVTPPPTRPPPAE